MKVGITVDMQHSMFSAGHPNSSIAIAECFQFSGHDVILIHQQPEADWWDDVLTLKSKFKGSMSLNDALTISSPLDLLIEVSFLISPTNRAKIAKYCVWYNRKPLMFSDIETTAYNCRQTGRNLEGISAIWSADIYTTPDDVDYLQSLYPSIPIEIVPWLWTPSIVEAYCTEKKSPLWLQVYKATEQSQWSIHITESNFTNTSSCILPLVILRNAYNLKPIPISAVNLHNTDHIKDNKFFQENVFKHTAINDNIEYRFIGRQRIVDWTYDPRSIILSHSRFVNLKTANLEAVWVGIPVIHNSKILKELGNGLEQLYYDNNHVGGASECLHKAIFQTNAISYLETVESLYSIRRDILERFSPKSKQVEWMNACSRLMSSTPVVPVIKPLKLTRDISSRPKQFVVLTTDMWSDYNYEYNQFTLAIENALEPLGVKVLAYSLNTLPKDSKPDIVIFGPFSEQWKYLPEEWPKVEFLGENCNSKYAPSVKLHVGFRGANESEFRLPLWMLYIDWFGAEHKLLRNPLPIPVDSVTKVYANSETRKKFCAFIVTNPSNTARNSAFNTIHSYKPVDSAGRLFNNVGDAIIAGYGGGGGEIRKHEFLQQYRFCITYENSSAPGYTTEKILHAKAAGCIPIYWGDPFVCNDFDPNGFLNANDCKSDNDLIRLVKTAEENPEVFRKLASVPALDLQRRDGVRKRFSELVKRIVSIAGYSKLADSIPEYIGATTTAEANELRRQRIIKRSFGVDAIYLVNLDRRKDRMTSFLDSHPELAELVTRFPAYDGRILSLTPSLARLFKPNNFAWKKAIMGCALSHLKLQTMLLGEPSSVQSFLILEDDVRLCPGWREKWRSIYPNLPGDWDCVYLGGVLPPNKPGLASCIEPVSPGLARIAPNKNFGQQFSTRYFHFCTYAYVLSRRGAEKLVQLIKEHDGYWISADHLMCNEYERLNIYLTYPLLAGSSQDEDPAYKTSQFNNYNRIDNFDSDIWNNDERFLLEELNTLPMVPLDIDVALKEIHCSTQTNKRFRYISFKPVDINAENFYEQPWLEEILNQKLSIPESLAIDELIPVCDDELIVYIRRPHWELQLRWLNAIRQTYKNANKKFKIIHLSDEFIQDPIHMYLWPEVSAVLRFYTRPDLPNDPKILVVPLGYHWKRSGPISEFFKREYVWSFAGTNWKDRSSLMRPLIDIQPHYVRWFSEWNDPGQLSSNEYLKLLDTTRFVPCPRGHNLETYRFYEALESGCIPVFVYTEQYDAWFRVFQSMFPILIVKSWPELAQMVKHLDSNKEDLNKLQLAVSLGWMRYKVYLKSQVCMWLKN
jgi:GR25 family glycosyltransferase involved in LPS biosynthesis